MQLCVRQGFYSANMKEKLLHNLELYMITSSEASLDFSATNLKDAVYTIFVNKYEVEAQKALLHALFDILTD